jgi:hypothetical protein
MDTPIRIRGARQHNLKGLDLDLPRRRLTVITGPSGSGKSSLALDTLFAEGQRRYVESLSPNPREFTLLSLSQGGSPPARDPPLRDSPQHPRAPGLERGLPLPPSADHDCVAPSLHRTQIQDDGSG